MCDYTKGLWWNILKNCSDDRIEKRLCEYFNGKYYSSHVNNAGYDDWLFKEIMIYYFGTLC